MHSFHQTLSNTAAKTHLKNQLQERLKIQPEGKLESSHIRSKSFHIGSMSGNNYLEDSDTFNELDPNFYEIYEENEKKSMNFNIKNLENSDNRKASIGYNDNRIKKDKNNNDFSNFNTSDDKFLSFLDQYLNYLEKNKETSVENPKEDSIFKFMRENEEKQVFKKIFHKYKKKCSDYQTLQKKYWKQREYFKSVEKNLQKVS